jgi:hypothetical protein
VLLEGITRFAVLVVAAAIIQGTLDYYLRLVWSMRAAMAGGLVVLLVVCAWRWIVRPLRLPLAPADVAHLVERRYPELATTLVSAVRFSQGEIGPEATHSRELASLVVEQAAHRTASIDFDTLVRPGRARKFVAALAATLLFTVVLTAWASATVELWFLRDVLLLERAWPQRTMLRVAAEREITAARGDDLEVRAHAEGVVPRLVEIVFRTAGGRSGRERMIQVGEQGFRHTFREVTEPFVFYLEGGDDRTDTYRVVLAERPRVEAMTLEVTPPSYVGQEPYRLGEGQRSMAVLRGSRVSVSFRTNKPVVRAALMSGRDEFGEGEPFEDGYRLSFPPAETRTYEIALRDAGGLEDRQPTRFSIRVVADAPPRTRLRIPGVGDVVVPEAVLPLEVEFDDTYGLATAELICEVSREGFGRHSISLEEFRPGMTTYSTSLHWPVAEVGAAPPERIALYVRATDFDNVSGPNTGQSTEITVRVVLAEELRAELARREQEARAQLERVVEAQEAVRRDLLTVMDRLAAEARPDHLASELTALERRQRTIAGSVHTVRQLVAHVLDEMRINRLNTPEEEERLGGGVVQPLYDLSRRELVEAADRLRWLARSTGPSGAGEPRAPRGAGEADVFPTATAMDEQQAVIIERMRTILNRMLQWEGYQEVITMLREILRLQEQLRGETERELLDRANDLFDD